MNLDKAILSSSLAGTFLRVPIGLYFFLSGRLLLNDSDGLVEAVKSFDLLSNSLATLLALILPYLEIVVGVLLVLGFWTSLAAMLAILILSAFIYAFGVYPDDIIPFNKDIVWVAACFALLSSGPGAFSIDGFRNKKH